MSENKVKLEWDGEKIKHHVEVPDVKMSPKDLIDAIDNVESEIDKMNGQKLQISQNLKQIEDNLLSAKIFKADRLKFESKCMELCLNKLKKIIKEESPQLIEEAEKEGIEIVSRDPEAYTADMIINQKYVIYQKKLATHKKVSEKIPNRMLRESIYDKPIYDNPFK